MAKRLTSRQIEMIRSELRAGEYHSNIAAMVRCSKATVDSICRKMIKNGELAPYWSTTWN